jgi:hypothetical protein
VRVTIQDLGSIGELIAAVATMATLVYLALQIRGNAAAVRADARRAMDTDLNEAITCIAGDPDVAELFMLGLGRPDALDPQQAFRFRLFMSHFFSQLESAWKAVALRTLSAQELSESIDRCRPFLQSPGGRVWWSENSSIFPETFREYLESQVPALVLAASDPQSRATDGAA